MAHTAPSGDCDICGGRILWRSAGVPVGAWVHTDKRDWVDKPHAARPTEETRERTGLGG
jgi:hypothetical protein